MTAPAVCRIPLPWDRPPLTTNNNARGNPYARGAEFKSCKEQAIVAIRRARPRIVPEATRCHVTLVFQPADRRIRDADGLAMTLKACLDALVHCHVLTDDNSRHVRAVTCAIEQPAEKAAMWLEVVA